MNEQKQIGQISARYFFNESLPVIQIKWSVWGEGRVANMLYELPKIAIFQRRSTTNLRPKEKAEDAIAHFFISKSSPFADLAKGEAPSVLSRGFLRYDDMVLINEIFSSSGFFDKRIGVDGESDFSSDQGFPDATLSIFAIKNLPLSSLEGEVFGEIVRIPNENDNLLLLAKKLKEFLEKRVDENLSLFPKIEGISYKI